jgi:peroxiredoxin Q/BCP
MLAVDDPAPAFELPDQHDNPVALPEDGTAVVYFYPRANTSGCTTEAIGFRDAYDEFAQRGIEVFGISDDPVEDLADFADAYDLPFRLLSDADGEVGRAYDSYGERDLGDRSTEISFRNSYVVRDGRIALAYEGVTPEGHAERVLADIDDLD